MKIYIGADHAGNLLKEKIKVALISDGYDVIDMSPTSPEGGDDYPDYAFAVGEAVAKNKDNRGILICDTGIGMSVAANKVVGVRAALVDDVFAVKRAREHNDANILVLASEKTRLAIALDIVKHFISENFPQGERHMRRVNKISYYEQHHRRAENE